MHVIGTVGLPGSGKGEAATVAREDGIPVVTMGDVVRQETADRGLDPTKDHGTVAQALREENGPAAIAERSLPMIEDRLQNHETVLVDGIRSDTEVDTFEKRFGESFTLISIEAPFEVRADRIDDRGRDVREADGGEGLAARDERERGFGMDDAMDRADVVVENTDSLEAFHERIRSIIRTGSAGDDRDRDCDSDGDSDSDGDRTGCGGGDNPEAEPEPESEPGADTTTETEAETEEPQP
ncbi:AAA family ATPase [Natrialba asiatica]|uniref:Dephospho-CoA kinase-like protein n=1 Tax=Natrialba asiatica (strain ATCC 700177 / DSM 12278 / JCM 9576 / FERM P-10747 / NBRC 102637 / 172P1) TaxID=29540 RepID=M0AJ32_NATA1|nr:AAA family ATPase [Natrialba asiatica]ELY97897.1 Dephospho-CoA kinase-like protein [Natrialba asiatica DSM 12278]